MGIYPQGAAALSSPFLFTTIIFLKLSYQNQFAKITHKPDLSSNNIVEDIITENIVY